ncbi:uncharacterized protein J4E79_000741 [Alternaria viburni]|uniref:uncharacterized protein n=1 Tax=Alternaria viburni TaxID=566460 RepID=UPI0020C3C620|nr:uncharacterized protein J4E79_000741 [Alternaria viburni]KAI4670459.1 hypothetical protein J4E79_000741 [Alternaria viburni]
MSQREQQVIPDKDGRPLRQKRIRPMQGDWVLLREMDPNRPDIAQRASEQALDYDSGTEDDEPPDLNEEHGDFTSPKRRAITRESPTHSHMQTKADQQPVAMSGLGMDKSKSLNPGAKAKRTPKRSVILTQDLPKPQDSSFSKNEKDNDNTSVSQERSEEKPKEPVDHSGFQGGGHDQAYDQKPAKRVQVRRHSVSPRPSSPRPDVTVDGQSLPSRSTLKYDDNNEIRLRVDASQPLSLQFEFDGDFEGRTMRLVPTEDGMADLVISPGRDHKPLGRDMKLDRHETEDFQPEYLP